MRIYEAQFECMYPVGCHLIIAARSLDEAWVIAKWQVTHTEVKRMVEIDITESGVVSARAEFEGGRGAKSDLPKHSIIPSHHTNNLKGGILILNDIHREVVLARENVAYM
jgi:hypothetical protein